MHFHGVEYKPSSDGIWLPLFSGKGGNVKPGQSFTYRLTAGPGSAGFWPYHDHSTSMEESIAGGMFGGLSIAGRDEVAPTASSSSRSRPGTASRRSTGARSSATRRCSRRASARTCSGT